jgi:hypothetical protein
MKEKIRILQANIKQQMSKLENSKNELEEHLRKKDLSTIVTNFDKAAIGFYLHNFYNGCENIFTLIARTFENTIDPQTWHRSILGRMNLEIEGIRPAVIDEELVRLLDNFRDFRHVFRHCYSFELDWNRERIVLEQFDYTFTKFKEAMDVFIGELDDILK